MCAVVFIPAPAVGEGACAEVLLAPWLPRARVGLGSPGAMLRRRSSPSRGAGRGPGRRCRGWRSGREEAAGGTAGREASRGPAPAGRRLPRSRTKVRAAPTAPGIRVQPRRPQPRGLLTPRAPLRRGRAGAAPQEPAAGLGAAGREPQRPGSQPRRPPPPRSPGPCHGHPRLPAQGHECAHSPRAARTDTRARGGCGMGVRGGGGYIDGGDGTCLSVQGGGGGVTGYTHAHTRACTYQVCTHVCLFVCMCGQRLCVCVYRFSAVLQG